MIVLTGKGVSKGMVRGPVHFFRRLAADIRKNPASDVQAECGRVKAAQIQAAAQLRELAEKARGKAGDETAALFETHALLAKDEIYTETIRNLLQEQRCCAEYAVQTAGEQVSAMMAAMDDEYLSARAADIRDVTRRILNILTGTADSDGVILSDVPVILAADDLSPSETLQLDKSKILGFITSEGSDNSHTAILARAMGIPAVCGLGRKLLPEYDGRNACIDGSSGKVYIDPDATILTEFEAQWADRQKLRETMEAMKGKEDVTLDGRKLTIFCNIGSPGDVAAVRDNNGSGIGLFRSEFLYLAANSCPSEEEQFRAYRDVAEAMDGKPVIIRTLDIGADKQATYLPLRKEENPALGMRAIRICLNRPEIFRTQLRALYRASAFGNVAIMFPMITSVWEVRECRRFCADIMAELEAEGIPYNKHTEIGIMIETPASVLIADALAKEVDFFSVGTNDLTQYTLACDRQANDLGRFFDPRHPAVLRALKMAADAAHAAGIRIGICGELGADPELVETFLAIGIDELSVSPAAVLPLRAKIRKTTAETCTLGLLKC